jgi:polar amino acid transport system substrate-binding protein
MSTRTRVIRTTLVLSVITAAAVAVTGCSSSGTASSSSSSSSSNADIGTATDGVITLGADFAAIPNQFETNGTKSGFDVDMCNGIAKELGVKIKWVNLGFDSLIPGLQAKRFDGLCTAVNITAEREQIMNMVSYTKWGVTMAVPKKDRSDYTVCKSDNATCWNQFAGKTVAVPSGGSEVQKLQTENESLKSPMTILQFATNQEVYQAVNNGTADAAFADDPQIAYYNSNNGDAFTPILTGSDAHPVGLTTLKANTKLANAFVKGLKAMKSDGSYQKVIKKWGLEESDAFAINPTPTS